VIVCLPIGPDGLIDPRWGRAARLAIADVRDGAIAEWDEVDVGWDSLHDSGTEGGHHARVAAFLRVRRVEAVVVHHMGDPMARMLSKMGIQVYLGAAGDARALAIAAATQG
jgi:predicted Fe-Mo cluster-binding NifX family protein